MLKLNLREVKMSMARLKKAVRKRRRASSFLTTRQ